MIRSLLLVFLFITGCRSGSGDYDTQSHPFDQQVIARLPIYDSLSQLLIQHLPLLLPDIKEQNAFEYRLSEGTGSLYQKLPRPVADSIIGYLTQLGDKYLTGFDVYKDSSIRYSVRDTYLEAYYITARDRLSYYPKGGNMRRRVAPEKDTILNKNWQYWIRFDEQGF